MSPKAAFKIPEPVMSRLVGDETVILDLESGTYFGLDPVGARIWTLISEGKSFGALCDQIVEEYDVERKELERDVVALVAQLTSHKLLVVDDG